KTSLSTRNRFTPNFQGWGLDENLKLKSPPTGGPHRRSVARQKSPHAAHPPWRLHPALLDPPPHAAPCLWVQARQRWPRHAGVTALPRAQEHPALRSIRLEAHRSCFAIARQTIG